MGPSFLLHPLDILGPDDAPGLAFFPGMSMPAARKIALFRRVMKSLAEHFDLVPMGVHAARSLGEPARLTTHDLPAGAAARHPVTPSTPRSAAGELVP